MHGRRRTRHAEELARSHGATRCFMPRTRDPATLKPSTIFRCRQDSSLSLSFSACRPRAPQYVVGRCRVAGRSRHDTRPEINIISRVACAGDVYAKTASFYAHRGPCSAISLQEKPLLFVAPGGAPLGKISPSINNAKSSRERPRSRMGSNVRGNVGETRASRNARFFSTPLSCE